MPASATIPENQQRLPADDVGGDLRRVLISIGLLLAAFMSALDTTVANIALPHIQGNLSASTEQITWVITSYFVANAVTLPVSGWLAARFGLKPMLMVCVTGFTLTSMLCGTAVNLPELVLFRALQGVAAAPLMPAAQAVLINVNPPNRLGRAMAQFTMAAVVAPAIGPLIGGVLTENYSWRWCFYVNLPAGAVSLLLISTFLPHAPAKPRGFDFLGFASLGLAIAAFQLMLDRGTTRDWFSSTEICVEAAIAGAAFWIYLVHTLTARRPLFPPALLRDRNYVISGLFGFFFAIMTFTSFALMPLMMQGLLGYSVIHAGLLSMPRGVLMLVLLPFMGRIDGLVDRRLLVAAGLFFFVLAFWAMSRFDLSMSGESIVEATLLQGVGQAILFVPLSTLGFATIAAELRPDASALTALVRNVGGSIGVATIQALTVVNTQTMHASLAAHVGPEIAAAPVWTAPLMQPDTAQGALVLNAEITRQAMMVAYVDDFRLLGLIAAISIPLVALMRLPKRDDGEELVPLDVAH